MSWITPLILVYFLASESFASLNVISAISNITSRPLQKIASNNKDFIQIASENGYVAEKHEVTTEDGYILTIFRILPKSACAKKTPLLVMHGLLQAAEGFIASGPEAPGLMLAQECYDSWYGNVRGNYHSRKHKVLNPDSDLAFWKFSVDEIGRYDIPAMVDYVLDATNTKQLIYIGYSQGGGTFFIMNSERPEYADKIRLFIGLAPATRHYHTKSAVFRTTSTAVNSFEEPLEAAGVWELLSQGFPIQGALATLCQVQLLAAVVCGLVETLVDSPDPDSLTPEIEKRIFENAPAGTSTQNMARYGQSMTNLKFVKFDYGLKDNLKIYGNVTPPEYNFNATRMPSVVFHGQSDHIVDTKDVEWAVGQLPNLLEYITVENPLWNHIDMCYSRYWKETIFVTMKEYLRKYDDIADTAKCSSNI